MMKITMTCFGLLATPVLAQETFSLPAGCDAYATVQHRNCKVAHLFTCEGDPDGYQQRVDLGEEGVTYVGTTDVEAQWVRSFYPSNRSSNQLGPTITDAASFSALVNTGRDTFDFETTSDVNGVTRYVGWDELTGADIEVDGVTLLRTQYQLTAYAADGTELWSSEGNQFVVPQFGRFLSGTHTVTSPAGTRDSDSTPVDILFPGEDGFLARKPIYDCSVVLSLLEDF